ncbi:hypothetical protein PAXINDRAFT_19572 [Paxillus involutus ATCC 200175]|uniref:Cation/H+ exchanger transmembrane domain-containing protein n=1 Tax=Paxillus involutus ATCC 200175 TaxID=664439 RepID=A0A0C9TGW7_PAXIN|nr:hypothetical protein PAXINDRAFT_19572 [Paxillus involutus ATCC 200175]
MLVLVPGPTVRVFEDFAQREATREGGLLTGIDPTALTTSEPLRLWIVQVAVIIIMAQLLSLGLRRIKQPKVIAEVLGGILLGPTAFGRIPGFTEHIFPAVSLPYLSLVANIGLCLFLFLIGLEIDASIIKRNARMSVIVSLAGIALPFALGAALSLPLYNHFIDPSVPFAYFMLFTGVAYSITAFPVLCRILTELKLLDTNVGVVVLSAGVGNDVVGWTLLALTVALVNDGSGLTALWTLLICIAFTIFLLWPVKSFLLWLARKTGSTENGPTMFYMTVVMILLWACAFFADIVGVNAIFGAFLAGIIVPREGGIAITLTEKLEAMVSIVFLPLYFTLSGLNTNLGLLDNGITWAFTIAIVCLSFSGKFGGCTIAARLSGFSWREASTIGSLMSCKGLVELIVLNVGLEAGILSPRVFSMFVLEALTLTFLTTPLVTALYPPERRVSVGTIGGEGSAIGNGSGGPDENASITVKGHPWRHRFTVVLDKLDHIPGAMALTQLVLPTPPILSGGTSAPTTTDAAIERIKESNVSVDALRLIELSERTSAVMGSSVADTLIHTDRLLRIFRMFGELNELPVSTSLSVVPHDDLAHSVADHANRHASQLVLLPWLLPTAYSNTVDSSELGTLTSEISKGDHNPCEASLGNVSKTDVSTTSAIHSQFVRGVFAESKTDVALFIDTDDRTEVLGGSQHIFFPFFGGPDDRLALEFVVQLCLNPRITATVVKMVKMDVEAGRVRDPSTAHVGGDLDDPNGRDHRHTVSSTIGHPDIVYGQHTTQTRQQSETADNAIWSKYASTTFKTKDSSALLRSALSRVRFSDISSPAPMHAAIQCASGIRKMHKRLVVVAGRSRQFATENHNAELKQFFEVHRSVDHEVMRKTIGDVATAMVVAGSASAVVVLQAANISLE